MPPGSAVAVRWLAAEFRDQEALLGRGEHGPLAAQFGDALAVETHENWLEQHRYLNMDDLREHKKEALRRAA